MCAQNQNRAAFHSAFANTDDIADFIHLHISQTIGLHAFKNGLRTLFFHKGRRGNFTEFYLFIHCSLNITLGDLKCFLNFF
ncbi:unknown [Sutterella sp. CAG:521]|nr:unknown [Sutterella sp. CAG:521]